MVRPARPPGATGARPRALHSERLTTVYYGICAVAVTLLAARPVPRPDPVPLAVGLALFAAIVPVRVLVLRGPRYAVLDPVAYGVFFLGFVVLRHATGGAGSELTPLVFLPVIGAALHGSLRKLSAVFVAVFAVLVMPALVGSDRAAAPWTAVRESVIWTTVGICLGLLVHGLVARLAEHDQQQQALLDAVAGYGILTTDARGAVTALNDGARGLIGLAPGAPAPALSELAGLLGLGSLSVGGSTPPASTPPASTRRETRWDNLAGVPLTVEVSLAVRRGPHGRPAGWTVFLLDVTAAADARAAAARSELRWRTLMANLPETVVLVADGDLRHQVASGGGLHRLGLGDAAGRTLAEVFGPVLAETLEGVYREGLSGRSGHTEFTLPTPAGPVVVAMVTAPLPPTPHSAEVLVLGVDVTAQRRHEEALGYLADHDPLTGLSNRRRFDAELTAHLERCRVDGPVGAVLTLDLDQFKAINDTLGHSAGDEVIVATGTLLRARLRAGDVVSRLGGDEFAVLLRHVDPVEAASVAADIVDAVRAHRYLIEGSPPRRITVSIGVVPLATTPGSAAELMSAADLTMYDAKESGRDGYVVCDVGSSGQPRMAARIAWAERIQAALAHDRFVLHAQPILDVARGRVTAAELLLRMVDAEGQLVVPGDFLPVAERVGLITEIDVFAVRRAVETLAAVQRDRPSFRLQVNLSGLSVGADAVVAAIVESLQRTGADGRGLVLEITETVAIPDFDAARAFMAALRAHGVRFALDDFGAGYGSLAYVKHLRFDYLKIDGEFVQHCADDPADRLLIDAVVAMARASDCQTIAEFVTDRATLETVTALGVDHAQGYHVGRPVPLADLLTHLGSAAPGPAAAGPGPAGGPEAAYSAV